MERRRECYRTEVALTLECLEIGQELCEFVKAKENVQSFTEIVQSENYDAIISKFEENIDKFKKMEQDYDVEYVLLSKHYEELAFLQNQKTKTGWTIESYFGLMQDRSLDMESIQEVVNDSEFPDLNNYINEYIIFHIKVKW